MDTEQNKANAIAFDDLMFNQCQPGEAVAPETSAHDNGMF